MSHPSINRWGNNLFWYNLWYADKNLNSFFHQNFLFNELILTYIDFGLFFKKNIFLNPYWFSLKKLKINSFSFLNEKNVKYFQLMEHKNKLNQSVTKFYTRNQVKNIYRSKLWIFKFNDWLVLTLYSYQPFIKKYIKKKNLNKFKNFFLIQKENFKNKLILVLRYKLFFNFFLKSTFKNNSYYAF